MTDTAAWLDAFHFISTQVELLEMGRIFYFVSLLFALVIFQTHAFICKVHTRSLNSLRMMGFTDFFKPKVKNKATSTTPIKFR